MGTLLLNKGLLECKCGREREVLFPSGTIVYVDTSKVSSPRSRNNIFLCFQVELANGDRERNTMFTRVANWNRWVAQGLFVPSQHTSEELTFHHAPAAKLGAFAENFENEIYRLLESIEDANRPAFSIMRKLMSERSSSDSSN